MLSPMNESPIGPREEAIAKTVVSHWQLIKKEAPSEIPDMAREIESGLSIFQAAMKGSLPFLILGNADIRTDDKLIHNVGTIAGDPCAETIGRLKRAESAPAVLIGAKDEAATPSPKPHLVTALSVDGLAESHFSHGAVVCDTKWSLLRNDLVLLGAIHSGKECHLALPGGRLPTLENIWDPVDKRMRVFGREMAMLIHAGYKLAVMPNSKGLVFHKPCDIDTTEVTLESCRGFVNAIDRPEKLLDLIKDVTEHRKSW
jgi:hypothetical protein